MESTTRSAISMLWLSLAMYTRCRRVRLRPPVQADAPLRGGGLLCRSRSRPRCFTSPARSRIDCCVMMRPSPRAREASASSTATRISARVRSRSSPKAKGFLHRIFFAVKPSALDSLTDKGLLVRGELYFHHFELTEKLCFRQVPKLQTLSITQNGRPVYNANRYGA